MSFRRNIDNFSVQQKLRMWKETLLQKLETRQSSVAIDFEFFDGSLACKVVSSLASASASASTSAFAATSISTRISPL